MIKTLLNAAALLIGLTGIFFKANYWAGADILMLTGFALLLISIVAFTVSDNNEAGVNGAINYLMVATLAVGAIASVFKVMHWEGGGMMGLLSVVLMLLLTVMLLLSKSKIGASRQFLTAAFVLFTLDFAILSMPRKEVAPATAETMVEQPVETVAQ
ncbi:hypothetical protein [Hymenobacter sp. B81]|uniref:hypothetical protein n=1 Tax=Hymenobacter sp. B81 TaxID=3344878 RepID=UPI0037DCC7AB